LSLFADIFGSEFDTRDRLEIRQQSAALSRTHFPSKNCNKNKAKTALCKLFPCGYFNNKLFQFRYNLWTWDQNNSWVSHHWWKNADSVWIRFGYAHLDPALCTPGPGSLADPHVFEPPGSGSGTINQRYGSGSGSFYHYAKIVIKALISTVLWLLLTFYLLKMMLMYIQKVIWRNNFFKFHYLLAS